MNNGWLTLNDAQRRTTLEQAAINSGIQTKAIEKDWWVTLSLRALFSTPYAPYCIFKGGTSLSKGWNLLQRFSEDIDIALMPEAFGMTYQLTPSNSYVKLLKRNGCAFTSTLMKDELAVAFENLGVPASDIVIGTEEVPDDFPDKDPQTISIRYRSVIDPHPYLTEEVKMEFGVRSLKEPFADVPLQSILYGAFPNDVYKEEPFLVRIVAPHKTLMEKMFLLHEKFSSKTPAGIRGDRQSRHLYDIVQLMNTSAGVEVLEDITLYEAVIEHRRHYSRLKDVDYDTLRHAELSFVPSIEWVEEFRRDYESMQTSMIYGESPSFDELLNQLKLFNGKMRLVGTGLSLDQIIQDFLSNLGSVANVSADQQFVKSSLDTRAISGELISWELEMLFIRDSWVFQSIRRSSDD